MKQLLKLSSLALFLIFINILMISPLSLFGQNESRHTDTIETTVCVKTFPYKYMDVILSQPGEQYVIVRDKSITDSITHHLHVFVCSIDTISMGDCANNFPLTYDSLYFQGEVHQEISYENDSNGCPIYHKFDISAYPLYNDTIKTTVCVTDTPYVFGGNSYSESGTFVFQDTTQYGCDSITTMILDVLPVVVSQDTLIDTICSHNLPYRIADFEFTESGEYDMILPSESVCDTFRLHLNLTVNQNQYDTLDFNICKNDFPYAIDSVHSFDSAGTYYIFNAVDDYCDNITVVNINELPTYNDTISVNICTLDTIYHFADTSFSESTVYTYVTQTIMGCDSITTLVLNIGQNYNDTLIDTLRICQYDFPVLYQDSLISEEGNYSFDLKTDIGCDSTHISLSVFVIEPPKDTVNLAVCINDFPYLYGDTLLDSVGIYDLHIADTVFGGCDTLRHLVVNSLPVFQDSILVTVCANTPYIIGDSTLTEPGTYDIMLQSIYGCDSLVTVTLNHYPIYDEDTLSFTTCQNDLPFIYGDTSFTTPGFHRIRYESEFGCDSIVTLNLNILPIIYNADTLYETICNSQLPYTTNFGETVNSAGLYTFIRKSIVTGCDSVFYYRLTVNANPRPSISGRTFICTGTSTELTATDGMATYVWNNGSTSQVVEVREANTYRVTVTDVNGCQGTASFSTYEAALPIIQLSAPEAICYGSSATLTVSGTDHYVWDNGSTSSTITVHPTQTTTYRVTASSSIPCQREGSVTVVVNELPTAAITGESAICQGSNTTLLASGGTNYIWSTNSSSDRITVFNEGTYTVTVTDGNGCSNTASKVITVHNLPNVAINGRTPFCQGQSTTLTATGAVSYIWSTGEVSNTITTSFANTYTVTGTDANGCSSTASKQITIWQINAQITGSRFFCQGQHTTLNVTGNESYTYQWNDGSTASSLDIYTPGNYSVSVTNSLGCTNVISATVSEYPLPTPNISGTPIICQGRSTMLRASGGTSYVWSNGSNNAYISVNETGTYYVTVTNQSGCSATTSETVIVNPLPTITIDGLSDICRGNSVSLFAQSPTGVQYSWPMSGQQSQLINVSPNNTTTYSVLVTDENGCTNTASTTVTVHDNPTPHISGINTICQGETAMFSVNGGTSYIWSNGMDTPTINVTRNGDYTVTAYNSYGCSATASTTLNVNNLPEFTLTSDTSICQGEFVILRANAPANCTYEWSNGSFQNNITARTAGTYTVTVTNNNGCSRTRSVNVTVNAKPQISISGNTTFCQGGSTTLNAVCDANTSYRWDNGITNAPLNVSIPGTYNVVATNEYGCTQNASTTVSMFQQPTATIIGGGTICPGNSTTLIVSEAAHYHWSTGDTTHSITVTPAAHTSYDVTVTDQFGCQNTTSATVQISSVPNIQITGASSFCSGESTTLTVTPGYNYLWSNNSTAGSITINQAGTYGVTASNALGCTTSDSIVVTVKPLPELNFGVQHTICAGESFTYQLPDIEGVSYTWSNSSTGNSITVSETGTYRVTATNQYGCSVSASDNLIVVPLPAPAITGSLVICRGGSTVLTASGGTSYHWSNGSTTRDIAVFPNNSTSYSVTVTNEYNCSASTSVNVTVNTLPTINITGNRSFCEGGSTTLTASGAASYSWSNGSTSNTISISQPGTYVVTARNALNCTNTDSVVVSVLDNPSIAINGNDLVCQGAPNTLTAQGCVNYLWSTGENTPSITITPNSTTTYSVTGTDIHGCSNTVSKVVNVEALPDVHITGENVICSGGNQVFTASGASTYLWSTGSTEDHITVSNGGNYSVTATSEHGCTASTSASLIVNPSPVVSIAGSNTICENTTEILVAHGGVSYSWNTGSTDSAIVLTDGGTYTVTAENIYGCTAQASLTVTELAAPFVFLNSISALCNGGSTSILAYSSANEYLWSTGETSQNITVEPTESTTYAVTVTSENGCTKTDSVHITVNPTYSIDVSDNICQGSSYSQYGFSIPAQNEPGTFTFVNRLQSISGCDSIINLQLTVKPLPVLPETISGNSEVTAYGTFLYNVDSTLYANSYEWRVSNTHWELSNSTSSNVFLTINTNGSGILTVKAINSCGSVERSLPINCSVGVDEYVNDTKILLYPVPTKDILNVNLEDAISSIRKIQLVDLSGRVLQNITVTDEMMQIDCSAYAAGQYFVRFIDQNGRRIDTRKIIIQK